MSNITKLKRSRKGKEKFETRKTNLEINIILEDEDDPGYTETLHYIFTRPDSLELVGIMENLTNESASDMIKKIADNPEKFKNLEESEMIEAAGDMLNDFDNIQEFANITKSALKIMAEHLISGTNWNKEKESAIHFLKEMEEDIRTALVTDFLGSVGSKGLDSKK